MRLRGVRVEDVVCVDEHAKRSRATETKLLFHTSVKDGSAVPVVGTWRLQSDAGDPNPQIRQAKSSQRLPRLMPDNPNEAINNIVRVVRSMVALNELRKYMGAPPLKWPSYLRPFSLTEVIGCIEAGRL
jgi:hypothetical protein